MRTPSARSEEERRDEIVVFLKKIRSLPRRNVHSFGRHGIFWDSRRQPGRTFNPLIFLLSSPDEGAEVRWIGPLEKAADLLASGVEPAAEKSPVPVTTPVAGACDRIPDEIARLASLCRKSGLPETALGLDAAWKKARDELAGASRSG
jgi:hypothetical protein